MEVAAVLVAGGLGLVACLACCCSDASTWSEAPDDRPVRTRSAPPIMAETRTYEALTGVEAVAAVEAVEDPCSYEALTGEPPRPGRKGRGTEART